MQGDNMTFIENIDKERYVTFYHEQHASFMQSYEWGIFNIESRHQIPHYVGMEENGNILCEALLLEKKVPLAFLIFTVQEAIL